MNDVSVNTAVDHKRISLAEGFELGAHFEAGKRGGDPATGASIGVGTRFNKFDKPGDIGFNLGFIFGIHSIARSRTFAPYEPEDSGNYDECYDDPFMECEGPITNTDRSYLNPSVEERVEYRELALRFALAPQFEVGLARFHQGILKLGAGPQVATEFIISDSQYGQTRESFPFLISGSVAYEMDMGLEISVGVKTDLVHYTNGWSTDDRMIGASVGIGWEF